MRVSARLASLIRHNSHSSWLAQHAIRPVYSPCVCSLAKHVPRLFPSYFFAFFNTNFTFRLPANDNLIALMTAAHLTCHYFQALKTHR